MVFRLAGHARESLPASRDLSVPRSDKMIADDAQVLLLLRNTDTFAEQALFYGGASSGKVSVLPANRPKFVKDSGKRKNDYTWHDIEPIIVAQRRKDAENRGRKGPASQGRSYLTALVQSVRKGGNHLLDERQLCPLCHLG